MTEAQLLGFLRGPTTERVLEAILITIAGSPNPSGVLTYYLKSDLPRNNKDFFRIGSNQGALGAGSLAFNAHSIQMIDNANLPPLNQVVGYVLDHNGPDLMVTGMLNGCSFIMKPNAGRTAVRCAHLRPAANQGAALNIQCINTAGFVGDPGPVMVFGRNNYPDNAQQQIVRSCTVLGVRRGGVWSIFAQIFDGSFNIISSTQIL